jgi:hypothetical protein
MNLRFFLFIFVLLNTSFMNGISLLHLLLSLHVTGLCLMAGTSAADMVTFRAFRRRLERGDPTSSVLLEHLDKLGVLLGIGAALLVLSGVGMMALTHGIFMHAGWFKVKLVLVALLILNGFGFGGRQTARIRKLVVPGGTGIPLDDALRESVSKVRLFYGAQLTIFLLIIGLSVANV